MGTFKNILPEIDVLALGVEARGSNMLITLPHPRLHRVLSFIIKCPPLWEFQFKHISAALFLKKLTYRPDTYWNPWVR